MARTVNTTSSVKTSPTAPTAGVGPVVYRRARRGDLPQLAVLDNALYPVEGGWSLEMFRDDFDKPNRYYLVATVDGQIIGYAACAVVRRRGELTMNTVVPDWRGKGIGREMLRRRLAWLDRKVRVSVLQTRVDNDMILQGYARHGFEAGKTLEDYYGPGVHAVEMRRIRP
jgi:ribosomal-protein-alanine N-acetyltransferase